MKNSSRFELKMARNFTRSSRGDAGILGLFEDPAIELEPGELAIDELRVSHEADAVPAAMSSTPSRTPRMQTVSAG
jgi:hypothetical protein